jgi:type II secretory pathway component PulF
LKDVPYLRGSPAIEFAQTGEESGTLPEMLMRYAAIETAAIGHFHEQVATWLPRFVYLLVALKVALGIFALGGLAPKVPTDL